MVLEIAGFRETGVRIHEQTKFVFLVRINKSTVLPKPPVRPDLAEKDVSLLHP